MTTRLTSKLKLLCGVFALCPVTTLFSMADGEEYSHCIKLSFPPWPTLFLFSSFF